MSDQLSELYSDILDGSYDCVDRIIWNAFSPMGRDPGALRIWWRTWFGSDKDLDNAHLMRMAGRFSRRLRAWPKAKAIPVVDCPPGERKHEMAEQYLSSHLVKPGLFMVLVAKSPAIVWDVQMTGTGKIGRKKPMPPYEFNGWTACSSPARPTPHGPIYYPSYAPRRSWQRAGANARPAPLPRASGLTYKFCRQMPGSARNVDWARKKAANPTHWAFRWANKSYQYFGSGSMLNSEDARRGPSSRALKGLLGGGERCPFRQLGSEDPRCQTVV